MIGGGIAGCSAAYGLSEAGKRVVLLEKSDQLGGNIRKFGCKADDRCVMDNLCLVEGVFDKIKNKKNIEILYNSQVDSLSGNAGNYSLKVGSNGNYTLLEELEAIIIATGYVKFSEKETGALQWEKDRRILWASELEEALYRRKSRIGILEGVRSMVFIQCQGSRTATEKADYCSRACCGYSYRMARAARYLHPGIHIDMLYMDPQEAGYMQELSFEVLERYEMHPILCRPVSIKKRDDVIAISYEDREDGEVKKLAADLVILSEGMHPGEDNEKIAEIFNLQIDEKGFLSSVEDEAASGIYLAGTVKGPREIAESINEAKIAADRILSASKG